MNFILVITALNECWEHNPLKRNKTLRGNKSVWDKVGSKLAAGGFLSSNCCANDLTLCVLPLP